MIALTLLSKHHLLQLYTGYMATRLLKKILSFFIHSRVIQQHINDLTKLNFSEISNHFADEDLFIGDNTMALLIHQRENKGELVDYFYSKFYSGFAKKLVKVFDFKSPMLTSLAFLEPSVSQNISVFF